MGTWTLRVWAAKLRGLASSRTVVVVVVVVVAVVIGVGVGVVVVVVVIVVVVVAVVVVVGSGYVRDGTCMLALQAPKCCKYQ